LEYRDGSACEHKTKTKTKTKFEIRHKIRQESKKKGEAKPKRITPVPDSHPAVLLHALRISLTALLTTPLIATSALPMHSHASSSSDPGRGAARGGH
jgi:hypothetical protein